MQVGPNSVLALGCISWMWHEWLPAMEQAQIPSREALCSSEHQRVVVEGATIWVPFSLVGRKGQCTGGEQADRAGWLRSSRQLTVQGSGIFSEMYLI